MNAYQVMIEGVFVSISGDEGRSAYGFHSTFYLEAINAPNALQRVRPLLEERLQNHGVREVDSGPFRSYYWAPDIWEISGDKLDQSAGEDLGFSFFRVGWFERFYLFWCRIFFEKFRPWILVPKSSGTAAA